MLPVRFILFCSCRLTDIHLKCGYKGQAKDIKQTSQYKEDYSYRTVTNTLSLAN